MKIILSISLFLFGLSLQAKDYPASFFGIESNGTTMNTTSIQKAIDYIHENGGGRLVFSVGRYVTGSIYLKSNVTIHLKEGAIILGSLNPFDYKREGYWTAMIFALNQKNIGITGDGVIDGRGYDVALRVLEMVRKGVIKGYGMDQDRAKEALRPHNIYFKGCNQILIQGVNINNPASWNQQYDQCKNVLVESITVDSKNYWNNDGIDIVDCDSVIVRNSYFDASDDGICLKSHRPELLCQNVEIYNNVVRSSASGIKFGTYSTGGFKNVRIVNNTVFDTYRSAIAILSVDGGTAENIVVDSLKALNVGNAIFVRLGQRKKDKRSILQNVKISNVYAEIAATKADKGYDYEGPVEHLPRNISPASIVGTTNAAIENITLKNIAIHYPGGGNPNYAKVGLDELDKVPELADKYPEFSMFKELPAWGFYVRHAKDVIFENLTLSCTKKDYRTPVVLDDVHGVTLNGLKASEPGEQKESVYSERCSGVEVED